MMATRREWSRTGLGLAAQTGLLLVACAGCRPGDAQPPDAAPPLGTPDTTLAPRLQYLRPPGTLWVTAAEDRGRAGVWRVSVGGRTASLVATADGGSLAAEMHGREEVAAWLSEGRLHLWHYRKEALADATPRDAGLRDSPPRWSPDGAGVAWVQGQEGVGGGWLRLYGPGQAAAEAIPLPALPQPRLTVPPVWSADSSTAWVLCDLDFFTRTVLGWSRVERRWYAWRNPLPESPSASSYPFVPTESEGYNYSDSLLQVAAGAQVFLHGRPAEPGLLSPFMIVLPGKWLPVGGPDYPLRFGAFAGGPLVVSPELDRVVFTAYNREHQRVLVAWAPRQEGQPEGTEPHGDVPLPADAPGDQEVALCGTAEAFLLAGSPGDWRVLKADQEHGALEDLVALPEATGSH